MVDSSRVILGLGCNLGDRLRNLRRALVELSVLPGIELKQVSSVYYSKAQLPLGAPADWDCFFLNIAVLIVTKWSPFQLLDRLQQLERRMGRETEHLTWSPRILDIDILLWEGLTVSDERLTIPHTRLLTRPFALWPAAELAADWLCAVDGAVHSLANWSKQWGSKWDGSAPFETKCTMLRAWGTELMGILNLTPDSFSDCGSYLTGEQAWQHLQQLCRTGASVVDVGAESTSPTAVPIDDETEWQRLQPFLDMWVRKVGVDTDLLIRPQLSVDSYHAKTLLRLLDYPVDFYNLVLDIPDRLWQRLADDSRARFIFMHNMGLPSVGTCISEDVSPVQAVFDWGERIKQRADRLGVGLDRLVLDVGIGFGKSAEQSWQIIKNIERFKAWQVPILVGHSRKSYLQSVTDQLPCDRDLETAILSSWLADRGVDYLRVHDPFSSIRAFNIQRVLWG